jgi:hypothetical protein
VSPSLEGEVLETIGVHGSVGAAGCGGLDNAIPALGVVLDHEVSESGHVEETVDQVGSPEESAAALADVVALRAHLAEALAEHVGWRADDGLAGGVVSTPVAGPG